MNWAYDFDMSVAIKAIYEGGKLLPLEPLDLADRTVVRISVETPQDDVERAEWLQQGQRTLMALWDNEADDVYNELLTK